MITKQRTIKKKIVFEGIGVHSGKMSMITLWPAQCGIGIVFCNAKDSSQQIKIGTFVPEPAMHATVLKTAGWAVSTVEHLMASFAMLGIDNVVVEVNGDEIPILDGSALIFVQEILAAGIEEQAASRTFLRPKKQILLADDKGRVIQLTPWDDENCKDFYIDYQADFVHPLLGNSSLQVMITPEYFIDHIAPARTFGFLDQLPVLRRHNLALGSSLGNTIVIGQELMNDLRFPDECVRHKILDLIGDMALAGACFACSVKACKTSHSFNRLVVEHVLQRPEDWENLKI